MKKIIFLFLISLVLFSCKQRINNIPKKLDKQILQSEIQKIIKNKNASVAISIKGLKDDFEMSIYGDKKMPMLSVYKLHIALKILELVDSKNLNLDQKILIKKEDLLLNTWSPIREKYPEGNISLSLKELLEYTVSQSDNNGSDILLRLAGGPEKVEYFLNKKGISDFQIKNSEDEMHQNTALFYDNYTTSNSATYLLTKLYEEQLISSASSKLLIEILTKTSTGTNKLKGNLPKNSIVAHKTGSSGKNDQGLTVAENDIGIIYSPNGKDYAISVFVSNSMEAPETNQLMIAQISEKTYQYFNQ